MTETTFTITTVKEISYADLWEAVWCSDGSGITYWCTELRTPEGGDISLWKDVDGDISPNPQDFSLLDNYEDKWHTVTLEQLSKGYELALKSGAGHCFGYPLDIEDTDECFGDVVLQYAVFGELVYG